jgi:hypothetical protein
MAALENQSKPVDDELVAKLKAAGIEEAVATGLAEIAADHFKVMRRPSDDEIRDIAATILAKLERPPLSKMDEASNQRLKIAIENFFISFAASGLFFLVQDYVIILKKFFMAKSDEAIAAQAQAFEIYERHRSNLSEEERSFIAGNLASLDKAREIYRAELRSAIEQVIEFEGLSIAIAMAADEPLFIDPYRRRV